MRGIGWCQACEQYEQLGWGCDGEGFVVPALTGESMAVIYDLESAPFWARNRRAPGVVATIPGER